MVADYRVDQEAGCYCYCVVGPRASLDLRGQVGVAGASTFALAVEELRAVISRVPLTEFGDRSLQANLQRMEWVESTVLGHESVVEACLGQTDVVPMKFCTIFRSEGDLATALRERHAELLGKLRDLEGKQEWGICLTADHEQLREHVQSHDPGLLALRDRPASGSAGAAYFLKKRMEDLLARTMEQARADAAEEAYAELAAVASQAALLRTAAVAAAAEPVLNAAFLVPRTEVNTLFERTRQILARRPWLTGKTTGPWPPYNFV